MDIAKHQQAKLTRIALLVAALGVTAACALKNQRATPHGTAATSSVSACDPSQLAAAPMQDVFDGTEASLHANWHSWKQSHVSSAWTVSNGQLSVTPGTAGDELVLNGAFEHFAISFHWAVSPGGNSGVKFNIKEASGKPVGFEYQILDDDLHPDAVQGRDGNRKTAGLYDILPRGSQGTLYPAGQFNHGCIVFQHGVIEHWLNGTLVLKTAIQDPDLIQAVAQSKFATHAGFLDTPPAQIFLQNHGEAVTFKDIKFLAL